MVVACVSASDTDSGALALQPKTLCGSGEALKDGQGEHCENVSVRLMAPGARLERTESCVRDADDKHNCSHQ
jgi:hypothetical protein